MVMEDSDVVFERVLHSVGDEGPFQRRFNILFNFLLSAAGTMTYMNLILVIVVPDFWCHVPGRNETNFTIDVWKELTLPRYGWIIFSFKKNLKYLTEFFP